MANQHFTVKAEHSDGSFNPGRDGMLRLVSNRVGDEKFWTGEFVDRRGQVTILLSGDYTRLNFVHDGMCHTRSWRRYFGQRTVARLCRAFITDVTDA